MSPGCGTAAVVQKRSEGSACWASAQNQEGTLAWTACSVPFAFKGAMKMWSPFSPHYSQMSSTS